MTEAEKAYEAAERLIAEAIESGAGLLHLNGEKTRALEVIPPQIAEAQTVTELYLSGTPVSDLSPIAGMTWMKWLILSNTQVSDISPIAEITGMTVLYLSGSPVSEICHIAGITGMITLDLSGTQVSDISHIAGMKGMTRLALNDTQVFDISHIARMTKMAELDLDGTQVMDLRPVRGMLRLVDDPFFGGLTFKDTPACRADAEIDRISKIKDHSDRARALFAYLEDWVPPGEEGGPLTPDDAIPVRLGGGKIGVDAICPDAMDALQESMHTRLRTSAATLSKAAGNQFPKLCAVARSVLAEAEKKFDDVDLLNLYLDNEALKDWQSVGAEDGMDFPDDVTIPLADVTRTVPGLTLGDEAIEKLVERINRDKGIAPDPEVEKRQKEMSATLDADQDAVDDSLRDLNMRLDHLDNNVASVTRKIANRNVLLLIAGVIGEGVFGVGQSIVAAVHGDAIVAMLQNSWSVFWTAARSISHQLAHYFASSLADIPALAKQAKQSLEEMKERLK